MLSLYITTPTYCFTLLDFSLGRNVVQPLVLPLAADVSSFFGNSDAAADIDESDSESYSLRRDYDTDGMAETDSDQSLDVVVVKRSMQ